MYLCLEIIWPFEGAEPIFRTSANQHTPTGDLDMSLLRQISPKVRNIRQSELEALGRRASQIEEELKQV